MTGGRAEAERIIGEEMALHGRGLQAMKAAKSTGLSRSELEEILDELMSGKGGAPIRVGWPEREGGLAAARRRPRGDW